ncbi:hypothetical protein TNCV_1185991 [Trichonephila clavipes]|nr:hypothetical protein TNCV_1185991 [Trichonephila clavipes]
MRHGCDSLGVWSRTSGQNFTGPIGDIINQVFLESPALEQVVLIHPGMAALRADHFSTQAKPVEVYSQEVMSGD